MTLDGRSGEDERRMDEALALAERGRGQTSPNPMVGAVVVSSDGAVVGSGYHERVGAAHAEVRALDAASGRASGATLYCTLEPCSHVGRTGPCVERIVAAGVRRVVVAVIDPNPQVSGSGISYLRERGVQVDVGLRRRQAARLNETFMTWVTRGRPFVTMKIATSQDGKIAAGVGVCTAITSDDANVAVHRLRAEVDAVAVGSNTVIVDDPLLTVRGVARSRPLVRVVFDRHLRTAPGARLFDTLDQGPVVIMTTEAALADRRAAADRLRARGASLEGLGESDVASAFQRLGALQVTSLLLEGGAELHRAAWRGGVVDRVQRFEAPVRFGEHGVPWIDDEVSLDDLFDCRVTRLGPDTLTEGYVHRVD